MTTRQTGSKDPAAAGLGLHNVIDRSNVRHVSSPSAHRDSETYTAARMLGPDRTQPTPEIATSIVEMYNQPFALRTRSAVTQTQTSSNVQASPSLTGDTTAQPTPSARHGWPVPISSQHSTASPQAPPFMYWSSKPHQEPQHIEPIDWRMRDRLKTVGAVLVPCLNLPIDPPDVVRPEDRARLLCWVDYKQGPQVSAKQPSRSHNEAQTQPPHPAQPIIAKNLQSQFESLSMRTRYKVLADPSLDELKKQCILMRRTSKDERVLFYYNGYGVPKPTHHSSEIWVFNKDMTQYIPLSLEHLHDWLRAPAILIYDCSYAGRIIDSFHSNQKKRVQHHVEMRRENPQTPDLVDYSDTIHLAACRNNEALPTNPNLPADIFTCCLTTPIDMAVRFFVLQNRLQTDLTIDHVRDIPGKISERRTPLGELNWIFTAITDTIAWNTFYATDKALFKKLFRQDLMVAALMRNFLLAQRVLRVYSCTPVSYPAVPGKTYNHPLWESWDYAVEMILQQLPLLKRQKQAHLEMEYQHSDFFTQQLSAFEIYLGNGALREERPEQLPIVLQVLLSQVHRLRALVLLSKFLDLGPWAVHMALSIGIFPYVLKLLQSQAQELKPVMIFIWARMLAIDSSCQSDLLKDNGYQYFIGLLDPNFTMPITNLAEHRAMCAFIIASFCKDYRPAQAVCLATNPDIIAHLAQHLESDQDNALLRQHACLCIGMLWRNYREAIWQGIRSNSQLTICKLVTDDIPEVRAAMLSALTEFLGIPDLTEQVADIEADVASNLLPMSNDGSVLVRQEYLVFLSTFIKRYKTRFIVAAWEEMFDERKRQTQSNPHLMPKVDMHYSPPERRYPTGTSPEANIRLSISSANMPRHNVFASMWRQVLVLSADPHPKVARDATIILDNVLEDLFSGSLGPSAARIVNEATKEGVPDTRPAPQSAIDAVKQHSRDIGRGPPSPKAGPLREASLSSGLRRTASMATSFDFFGLMSGKAKSSPPLPSSVTAQAPLSQSARAPQSARLRSSVPPEWSQPPDALDPHTSQSTYGQAKPVAVRNFVPRDLTVAPKIPLASKCFESASMYFREPQMRPTEAEEQGSLDFIERTWRRNRNEEVLNSVQNTMDLATMGQWNSATVTLANNAIANNLVLHQFEDHLLTSDDRDTVSIWDWERNVKLNQFSNGNPSGSRITDLRFVNEDDKALIVAGSSDGVVKLYRNYRDEDTIELASSFRALSDLVPSNHNAGMILNWQQSQGHMLVAGDDRVIRLWDAGTENCIVDVPARSGSNVTSMTSEQHDGNIFIAGFGDGAVRVFDLRNRPGESMVRVWREHKSWIVGTRLQRGGMRELITADRGGETRAWDVRCDASLGIMDGRSGGNPGTLRTLSVHDYAPVFAL